MTAPAHPERWLAVVLLSILLGGCLLSEKSQPITVIAPRIQIAPSDRPAVTWSLAIERPRSDALVDSTRILVRVPPSEIRVMPGAGWIEPVPDLLQSALLQGFEDVGRIAAVGRAGSQRSRYRLYTELRRFEAVETGPGLDVEIELHAKLILGRSGEIIHARGFRSTVAAAGDDPPALAAAFQKALGDLLGPVIEWTLDAPGIGPSHDLDRHRMTEPDPAEAANEDSHTK